MLDLATQVDLDALRTRVKGDLYTFAKGILGYNWLVPHIHGPVCRDLEDKTTNRKLIELPRGWLKTTLCSIAFPIWLSIQNPDIRILIVQNSATNAMKKLSVIGEQWEKNDLLRALFPELLPSKSSTWKADMKCLTRKSSAPEATYEAAGTSTRVVSRHYDVIIEDDTVAPDYDELGQESLAPTHDDVQKAIGWHRGVLPLLNNPSTDLVLVVGTRWYDQDLIRWVKDNEPQYKVITRACRENEHGEPDPKGAITYPERFDEQTLRELEVALGPYMFHCLYFNLPVRREDMAFKPEWFNYYEISPRYSSLAIYTTVDSASDPKLSRSSTTDYSAVITCGKDMSTGRIYVLDYFRKQCNPGEMCSAIFDHVHKYNPILVGYQDIVFERGLDYHLKEMMRQHSRFFVLHPLKASNRKNDKDLRIANLQPLFAGNAILLRTWMKDLVSELLKFPLGTNDDLADALSMQLNLWRLTKTNAERRSWPDANPFSFEAAVAELKARHSGRMSSPVFDPSRCSSDNMFTFNGRTG